jgi:hypothetical protein
MLGNYPDNMLEATRKLAREHRVATDKGENPAADKMQINDDCLLSSFSLFSLSRQHLLRAL